LTCWGDLLGWFADLIAPGGCEWLQVDFGPRLATFYLDARGFQSTPAGVIHLPSHGA